MGLNEIVSKDDHIAAIEAVRAEYLKRALLAEQEIERLKTQLRAARRARSPWLPIDTLPNDMGGYIVGSYPASAVTNNGWTIASLRNGVWWSLLLDQPLTWQPTHWCEPGTPPSGWVYKSEATVDGEG